MLVHILALWGEPSLELERETYRDQRFLVAGARFVWVEIDVTDDNSPGVRTWMRRYGVRGVPTIVLVSSTGAVHRKIDRRPTTEGLVQAMNETP